MKEYLTAGDASRILGVTSATVRLMERRGSLSADARTEGGIRLFRRARVESLQRRREAKRPPVKKP